MLSVYHNALLFDIKDALFAFFTNKSLHPHTVKAVSGALTQDKAVITQDPFPAVKQVGAALVLRKPDQRDISSAVIDEPFTHGGAAKWTVYGDPSLEWLVWNKQRTIAVCVYMMFIIAQR